jgi:hypothetical protein
LGAFSHQVIEDGGLCFGGGLCPLWWSLPSKVDNLMSLPSIVVYGLFFFFFFFLSEQRENKK